MGDSTGSDDRARGFHGSIWESWLVLMSGVLSVLLFAIAAIGESRDWSVPTRISFFTLGAIALYIAAYMVWKKERDRANRLLAELNEHRHKRKARGAIGEFLSAGQALMEQFAKDDPRILPLKESQDWAATAEDILQKMLDPSYVARFRNPAGLPIDEGIGIQLPQHRTALAWVRVRVMRLEQFLSELSQSK